jgi:Asp-tRNA(Asn)/Glu-tRNA(Gln) amidotransferase A subunit family amidase
MSSRAFISYADSRPPPSTSAAYVHELVDLGAIIVGKMKVASLGTGSDWVDSQQPWSSRAEGYQATQGSEAGAAVAVASYDWLDTSIGDDGMV